MSICDICCCNLHNFLNYIVLSFVFDIGSHAKTVRGKSRHLVFGHYGNRNDCGGATILTRGTTPSSLSDCNEWSARDSGLAQAITRVPGFPWSMSSSSCGCPIFSCTVARTSVPKKGCGYPFPYPINQRSKTGAAQRDMKMNKLYKVKSIEKVRWRSKRYYV